MGKKYITLGILLSILSMLTSNTLLFGMSCCSINDIASTSIPTVPNGVNSLAFTSNGCLAATNEVGELNIYSPSTLPCDYNTTPTGTISLTTPVVGVVASPSGCLAVAHGTEISIFVPSGSCAACDYDPIAATMISSASTAIGFSADNCLASGDNTGTVTIYAPNSTNDCTYNASAVTTITIPTPSPVTALAFSPTNNCLVVGYDNGDVNIYAQIAGCSYSTTISQTITPAMGNAINDIAFSSAGCLAIADASGQVTIYQPDAGCTYTSTTTIMGLPIPLEIAFSPNGCLAIGDHDGGIGIFSPTSGCTYNTIPSSLISAGMTPVNAVAFSPNGCLAGGWANSINIYAPNATLAATITPLFSFVCSGDTIILSALPTGGMAPFTYTWTLPDGSTVSTGSSNTLTIPNASQADTGPYTVTVTDSSGCITTANAFVDVVTMTASLQATPEVICAGQSSILTTNISGGIPPYTVTFSDGFMVVTPSTTVTHLVSPAVTTDYTVTIVDQNGCTTTVGPVTVTVDTPMAPTIGTVTVNCNGTITIAGSAQPGDLIEVFNGINQIAVPVIAANDGSFTITTIPLSPGSYPNLSVSATVTLNCSASTPLSTIVIPPALGVTISPSPDIVCAGSSVTLTANATGGTPPYTYAWTGPAGFTAIGPVITIPNASRAMAGIYNVTVTDSVGCIASTSTLVRVVDIGVTLSSSDQFLCNGDSATLTAIVTSGVPPYTFTFSDGFVVNTSNINVMHVVTPNMTTTYTVTVTDSTPCTATSTPNTIVVSVVTPPFNITAISNCSGVVLITGSADPGNTITVFNGAVAVAGPIIVPPSGNFNLNTSVLPAGTYTFDVTATNLSACTATTPTPPVIVNEAFSVSITPPTQTIALGSTLTLTANTLGGAVGATNYNWTGPNGFTQTGPSNMVIRPNATSAFGGTYNVVATDSAGCTASATATVTVM